MKQELLTDWNIIWSENGGCNMVKFTFVVNDEMGLHARPAGALVKEAAKCSRQGYDPQRRKDRRCKTDL